LPNKQFNPVISGSIKLKTTFNYIIVSWVWKFTLHISSSNSNLPCSFRNFSCVISDLINPGITIVIPISDPNSTLSHTCYTLLYLRINIVKTEWLLIEVTDTYLKDVDGKSYIMEA